MHTRCLTPIKYLAGRLQSQDLGSLLRPTGKPVADCDGMFVHKLPFSLLTLSHACRACAVANVTPAAYSSTRVFRPKAPAAHTFSRAFRPAVVAAAAAPQLKDIDHSDIASKVKRQLLINGKFVDAIGGEAAQYQHQPDMQLPYLLPACMQTALLTAFSCFTHAPTCKHTRQFQRAVGDATCSILMRHVRWQHGITKHRLECLF